MPRVNPELLTWARETAGLSTDEAAARLGIKPDSLNALEAGAVEPSRSLVSRMSKQYRRPLVAFYLGSPPLRGPRGEDFRALPNKKIGTEALVDTLVRDVKTRQALVRAILEEDKDGVRVNFIGSLRVVDGVEALVASMRATLGFELAQFRAQTSVESAFAMLRSRAEAAGVFVLLLGNLGSHHSAIEVESFRGFALADRIAPFVVINDNDAKSAWPFTLLHELAHLWVGSTGISGTATTNSIERFCNEVASALLLPEAELSLLRGIAPGDVVATAHAIGSFARQRHLSRSLVAYRLLRAEMLDEHDWDALTRRFREEWRSGRDRDKAKAREKEGGPNFYVVRRHRLGSALLRFVSRNLADGQLTPSKAGRVLGVKPRSVQPLLSGTTLPASAIP